MSATASGTFEHSAECWLEPVVHGLYSGRKRLAGVITRLVTGVSRFDWLVLSTKMVPAIMATDGTITINVSKLKQLLKLGDCFFAFSFEVKAESQLFRTKPLTWDAFHKLF